MSVKSYSIITHVFVCKCDKCGKSEEVNETEKIYNGAQAVRSLGWSFGKDKSVKCDKCRQDDWGNRYNWHTSVSASK
ncbi:MAG: hypothetical protein K2K60_05000 [Clostridia bacterium]|nr:hypothetical protein [Clostridia bacterium]